MSGVTQPRQRRGNRFLPSAVMILALWQLRRTWFLLLFTILGMVAAVVIVCAIPLLSDVLMTAGLRNTLEATPYSADIELHAESNGISTPIVQNVHDQFDTLFHRYLGNIIKPEQVAITTDDFSFYPDQKNSLLTIYGTSMQQATPHLGPIQGRLARMTSNSASEIEVMLTPDTMQRLGVSVGSTLNLSLNYNIDVTPIGGDAPVPQQHSAKITAHVVGLFTVTAANAAYWQGEDFTTMRSAVEGSTTLSQYTLLVPDNALLALFDHINSSYHTDATHAVNYSGYSFIWHYHLDSSHLVISNLDSLIDQLAGIQSTTDTLYGGLENDTSYGSIPPYPYLTRVQLSSPILTPNGNLSILEQFRSRIAVARIPTGVFTALILSLILFFVSLMTTLLVDRQTDTVAIIRSRGASSGQIFGALLLQSIGLGIIALVLGLPLATSIVLLLSQHMLPASELDALNVITSHPLGATLGTMWYALAIIFVAILTMSISLFFAARMNILFLRRESARSNKRPLWQRLNLDVIAGILALVGYGLSLYVTSIGTVLQGDAKVLLATPLSIIAPFFLIVGCLFLFLRMFPLLLQLGARFAARGRGAVSLLAFAQMARSPRQSLRMTLLLALATAFALFTLVYTATQSQHIQEIVSYQTGADFSAQLLSTGTSPSQILNQYQAIPGVLSTSAGYINQGEETRSALSLQIRAVDAASFGGAVIWPSPEAFATARPLLSELVSERQSTTPSDVLPAIVDATTINRLQLHVGSFFTVLLDNSVSPQYMHCVIIGVVEHIPTINDRLASGNGEAPSATGSVLVDYSSYVNAYLQDARKIKGSVGLLEPPSLNQIWMHTKEDTASLTSVRATLNNPKFRIANLVDRRLLLATLQSDPLYLVLDGILSIGTTTALVLALIGDLLASWLSARTRLTNFAMLRALGTTSSQVTSMLTWEQAIIYITGFLLGAGFGTLLATSVIPALTFTDLNSNLSNQQLFALQSALATQLVVPPSLPLVLVIGMVIFVVALTMMVRVASQPALSQTLRLNED